MLEDLLDIGFAGCRDYVDMNTGRVKTKYLDPVNLIAQYSRSRNYENSSYFGYVEEYTIAELRVITGLPETMLNKIAHTNSGYYGNPAASEWDDDKKKFRDNAVHDWTSHPSDAYRS